MKEHKETKYIKRTQKDYSMSFKLQVVQEVERGDRSDGDAGRRSVDDLGK